MKRMLFILCVVLIAGCSGNSESEPTSTSGQPKAVNATNPVAPLTPPTEFTASSESLFAKPLLAQQNAAQRFILVEDSGVEFENQFDRDKPYRFIETGAGVALGDYDSDGIDDIYLVATDGPNRLYRGLGDFKFKDVTSEAGVDGSVEGKDVWGAGASFADIDNDGDLDLFVANMAAVNLLYLNNGDGTFTEGAKQAGLARRGANKIASFCDYDRDGDLDLYLLTYQDDMANKPCEFIQEGDRVLIHPDYREWYGFVGEKVLEAGEPDFLYQNNGDGTFTDVTEQAGLLRYDMGLSARWFDYDDDGWPDLHVANDFWQPDHLFKNNGDGTFTDVLPKLARHTPWFSMGSDSGDLNNDGLVDLMVADMSSRTHYKQKLNMGNMQDSSWFLTTSYPRQYMRNCMYINTGVGRFMESAFQSELDSTDWTWAVRFADFDCDGLQDVFVTNGHARDSMNADIVNDKQRMKEDGKMDAVLAANKATPPVKEKNAAYKNQGNFEFESIAEPWGLDHEGVSHGVAFADFDSDGDLDIVVNNLYEPANLYRNDLKTGKRILVELRSHQNNFFGIGAKVEIWHGDTHQVRTLSPVRGYISSDAPYLHFGTGNDSTIDRIRVTWPNGKVQEYADQNTNQHLWIIENEKDYVSPAKPADERPLFAHQADSIGLDFQHKEVEYNDYDYEPLLPYKLSQLGPGLAIGDINNDGFSDVFVAGSSDQSGKLYVNREGKSMEPLAGPWDTGFQFEQMGAVFFDADGDGDEDLYVVSGGNEARPGSSAYRDLFFLNMGEEKFENGTNEWLPNLSDSGSCVAAADFDQDGDIDLFVGSRSIPRSYPQTPTSRLLRNDGDKFTEVALEVGGEALSQVGLVNSAMWSDYDQDGWVDLLVANDWGPIAIFRNDSGKLVESTASLGLDQYRGWWRGLAAGDFDHDGDLDYVVTNQGLNTKYHADSKHPHRIYFDDFDENGSLDLVESEYEGDKEFPVRGRSCSSNTMPFIADKFETFDSFALATVSDIYGSDLDEKPYVELNYLSSAILWNEGQKGMKVQPLPSLAQLSPGFGITANDFDQDGSLDLIMANNFYGSQPETGIMDGGLGLFLKGNAQEKSFTPVWPKQSGIVLPFDSMGLATTDLDKDGDLDAIVSVNQGKVEFLQNQSESGKRLSIELTDANGNRNPIGVGVLVTFKAGTKRRLEVHAGGSYLSQSDRTLAISGCNESDVASIKIQWPDGTTKMVNSIAAEDSVIRIKY